MLVNGVRFPVVKMQWVDGQPLDGFVGANLGPERCCQRGRLRELVTDLERKRIAHGDLQPGNILVPDGIRLVDYDGMFVPAFDGHHAPETGVAAFSIRGERHRTTASASIAFRSWCSARPCPRSQRSRLWEDFNTGDNLLFPATTSPIRVRRDCSSGSARSPIPT